MCRSFHFPLEAAAEVFEDVVACKAAFAVGDAMLIRLSIDYRQQTINPSIRCRRDRALRLPGTPISAAWAASTFRPSRPPLLSI